MKFIRKKNFQENEELLYVPKLHWMYTIRHMVLLLPVFLILFILWGLTNSAANSPEWLIGFESAMIAKSVIKSTILGLFLLGLLIFVWKIFLYLCTEFGVTNKRIIIKKGIIRVFIAEIPTDRIESIYCYQGLMGRIFRYGTLYLGGIGGKTPFLKMVARPYALRRKIVDIIEKNKTINVIHGDLPKAQPPVKPEPVVVEEPIYRYGTFVRVVPGSK